MRVNAVRRPDLDLGQAGGFGINFVSIGEGPPDRDAPPKVGGLAASQVIRDPQVIAVIGTLFFSVAGHHGITAALEKMLYVEAGTLVAAMGLVFLLPMRARESDH